MFQDAPVKILGVWLDDSIPMLEIVPHPGIPQDVPPGFETMLLSLIIFSLYISKM